MSVKVDTAEGYDSLLVIKAISLKEQRRRYVDEPSECCDESISFSDEYHDFRLYSFQQLFVADFYFVRDFLSNTY